MIITSDTALFNPVYNTELANKLRSYRDKLNHRMTPIKFEWVRNVLNYNKISKEAIKYRFEAKQRSLNIKDRAKDCFKTDEAYYKRPYIVSNKGMKKVQNFNQDLCARNYTCQVKSTVHPDQLYNVQSLMNNVFDKSNFQSSLQSAFFDATTKKVGYLRNRVYNTKKNTYLTDAVTGNNKTLIKQGHAIEYVDVENVIVDPYATNPNECFICTPYSAADLINLIPQLKPYLQECDGLNATEKQTYYDELKQCEYDMPFIYKEKLRNYKLGKALVEIYNKPDLINNIPGEEHLHDSITEFLGHSLFRNGSINNFNGIVYLQDSYDPESALFGNYSLLNTNEYLLNEYYDWNTGRYAVFIGDYILYDGAMFGDFIECPLAKVYFEQREQDGWFGRAVLDSIWTDLVEADITYNKNERGLDEARIKLLDVNYDLIDTENNDIEVQEGYTYVSRNNSPETVGAPLIQQIAITDPLIASYGAIEQAKFARIDEIYPDTTALNVQLSKEAVQDTIFSRDRTTNAVLGKNSIQLSKFAYSVYAAIIFSIQYLGIGEVVVKGKLDDTVGLVIRESEEDLEFAKQQVGVMLKQDFDSQMQVIKDQVQQSDKFKEAAKTIITQTVDEINQEHIKYLVDNNIEPTQEDNDKLQEMTGAKLSDKLRELTEQMAGQIAEQQGVKKQNDTNWYYTTKVLVNSIGLYQEWSFEFGKSKAEQKQGLINLVQTLTQLPIAGYQIDYMGLMKEYCNIENISPSIISEAVLSAPQIQGMINTRLNIYADTSKDPNLVQNFYAKMSGIDVKELSDVNSGSFNYQKEIAAQKTAGKVIETGAKVNPEQALQQALQQGMMPAGASMQPAQPQMGQ